MPVIRYIAAVLATVIVTLAAVDGAVRFGFPSLPRFGSNFSAAYLSRTLTPEHVAGKIAFAGDSVLWGYGIPPSLTAAADLSRLGIPVVNLAFEGGSMVNTYALIRLMASRSVLPRTVVFNVNIKEFNAVDSAYRTLHPAVETLAWPYLSVAERQLLTRTQTDTRDAVLDRSLSSVWQFYGLRTDVRELLFNAPDAANALSWLVGQASGRNARAAAQHLPTADRFLGTYDLTPLADDNVEVVFLRKTVALLAALHVRAIAIITPTNHTLLHEYIDVPEYADQLRYVARILGSRTRVVNST